MGIFVAMRLAKFENDPGIEYRRRDCRHAAALAALVNVYVFYRTLARNPQARASSQCTRVAPRCARECWRRAERSELGREKSRSCAASSVPCGFSARASRRRLR
jgi:hypothetical protein